MTTSDPKDRILEAAERILSRQGIEAVSLRSVTAEAGVNIAAVNYYFGSKAALLQAMAQRFFLPVNREQLRRLAELEAKAVVPSVEELLVAYAWPIFELFDSPRGRDWAQALMMAHNARPEASPHNMMGGDEGTRVTSRYYEALRRALPHLSPEELWWRFERAHNLLMANQGKRLMPSRDTGEERTGRDERVWLITFLVGGLQAAAASAQKAEGR